MSAQNTASKLSMIRESRRSTDMIITAIAHAIKAIALSLAAFAGAAMLAGLIVAAIVMARERSGKK